jgi:hypothetical protein
MMELWARCGIGFNLCRPLDDQRVACASEVRGEKFRSLVGGAAGPRPACVVHVVGLGCAKRIEAAKFVQHRDVLLDGGGDSVLCEQLADRAVLSFGRGAVVAPDVEDERVVAITELVDFVDDPADLGKPGERRKVPRRMITRLNERPFLRLLFVCPPQLCVPRSCVKDCAHLCA